MSVEAPERIWVYHNGNSQTYLTAPNKFHNIEYVLADKLEELAAENERLQRSLLRVQNAAKTLANAQDSELCHRRRNADYDHKLRIEHESLIERDAVMTDALLKAEATLAEAKRENEALRGLVDSAESIFINCSVTDGMCCCGDNMENHPSPMSCGHTPVDHGSYQVDLWIKARNAGGKDAE